MNLDNRKKLTLAFWIGIGCILLLVFCFWFFYLRYRAYTDDAYVEGNQIVITPLRNGFVNGIYTDDTFLVEKGQVLVSLDKTDALIALSSARDNLANSVREVCGMFHQLFALQAELEVKKADLWRSEQDFIHREDVLEQEGVSLEDYQHAKASLEASAASLRLTQSLYDKARSAIWGTSIHNHPLVEGAASRFRDAWVQLYRSEIYAPAEGLTAQRTIQVGMWAPSGQPLMSVIPLDQIWVNANFKETQMKQMRIGQKVKITSDLYGRDVVYHGHIVGLPGGAGNAFSLLPPQNLSGNWIKIVQRLPVRVKLDPCEIKKHPLRIGLSMEALVDLTDEGTLVPTSIAGSPNYCTTVYDSQELGDREVINTIIKENLDPLLASYAECPLIE